MEPLTADEAQFAADSHSLVFHYLSMCQLSLDEYYDIVALGYLRAVKKWFSRTDLRRKYKFTTIAWSCMRTDVGNFQKSLRRRERHEAFSLDSPIPGAEHLTHADTIQDPLPVPNDMICIRETLSELFSFQGSNANIMKYIKEDLKCL
jgi:hypothetical protein